MNTDNQDERVFMFQFLQLIRAMDANRLWFFVLSIIVVFNVNVVQEAITTEQYILFLIDFIARFILPYIAQNVSAECYSLRKTILS